jgi:hypothetical protein
MAKYVQTNCGIYVGGYEFSGRSNTLSLEMERDLPDCTCFGDAYRTRVAGITDARFSAAGYWDAEQVDAVLFDQSDDAENIATFAGVNSAGGVCYFVRGVQGQYQWGAAISAAATWSMSGASTQSPVVRGILLDRTVTLAATGSSSPGYQHGAVGATQSIYATLHVFAVAGTDTPTVTAIVQSDDNSGFTTPTTRLSFTARTAIGSQWVSASPGAVTDDWWRVNYTVSGTAPVFGLAVGFGIL